MATKSEVIKQQYLNTTAILAFTDLVRRAQVNNATAHNYYPVHSFGRLSPKNTPAVEREYIPYLARALKHAVSQADSHQIQVYIRALGNVAHPRILSVFEPYLEGKESMSNFQRLLIVASMDQMAKVYPKVARQVLFRVYQNSGESYQVRSAAVFQLMKTNPPAAMLQRMAEYTNNDHSNQVSAAVKSAIESAALLHGPANYQL